MGGRVGIERKGQKRGGPPLKAVSKPQTPPFVQPGSWWTVPREAWRQAVAARSEQSWGPFGQAPANALVRKDG
jgi:hypothetical protein